MAGGMENKILAVRFAQRKYALEKYELGQIKKIKAAANKAINEYLDYAELKKDAVFGQGKWTREKGLKYVAQLKKLDKALQQQVVDMTTGAGKRTFKDAIKAYEGILSFDGTVGAFNFTDLSPEKLEALVKGIPVGGNTLKEWADRTLDRNVQKKIRDELLAGSLKGENIEQLKRRVRQRYKTFSRNTVDVMVRTHVQSANNHALEKVYAENRHIVHRVQWLGTLDAASCLRCAALDGREYEHNDHPHIPLHPRCRCVLLPVTRTWREMGLDRDEMKKRYRPELQDDGTYKKVQKTYTQRYNEMSPEAKRAYIGPGRYNYLEKSKLDFPDLVEHRTGRLYLIDELPDVEKAKEIFAAFSAGTFSTEGATIGHVKEWAAREKGIKLEGFTNDDLGLVGDYFRAVDNSGTKRVKRIHAMTSGTRASAIDTDPDGNILTWDIGLPRKAVGEHRKVDAIDFLPNALEKYYDKDLNYNMAAIEKKLAAPTVIRNNYDVAIHEIGHVETLANAKLPGGFKNWGELDDAYRKWVDSDDVQGFFSGYAAKNYSEALAEAFVLIKRGEYKRGMLPPYLEELLGFERAVVTRKASDELVEKMIKKVEAEEMARAAKKNRAFELKEKRKARN